MKRLHANLARFRDCDNRYALSLTAIVNEEGGNALVSQEADPPITSQCEVRILGLSDQIALDFQ